MRLRIIVALSGGSVLADTWWGGDVAPRIVLIARVGSCTRLRHC